MGNWIRTEHSAVNILDRLHGSIGNSSQKEWFWNLNNVVGGGNNVQKLTIRMNRSARIEEKLIGEKSENEKDQEYCWRTLLDASFTKNDYPSGNEYSWKPRSINVEVRCQEQWEAANSVARWHSSEGAACVVMAKR